MSLGSFFTPMWFLSLLYSLPAILIALSFHEYAHGLIAYKCGDPTAKNAGRLTLDPVKHLDLIGTICLVLLRFGWAKPVPINPRNFKHPKRDEILVSIAGACMNLLISFVACAVLYAMFKSTSLESQAGMDFVSFIRLLNQTSSFLTANSTFLVFFNIVYMIFMINVFFTIFNLIPIPPLDGFHIISALFIRKAGQVVNALYRYGFIIVLILMFTGVFSMLLYNVLDGLTFAFGSLFMLF